MNEPDGRYLRQVRDQFGLEWLLDFKAYGGERDGAGRKESVPGGIRQVTVTLNADTFERLQPDAARKIRHIVEEAVGSEVNIR